MILLSSSVPESWSVLNPGRWVFARVVTGFLVCCMLPGLAAYDGWHLGADEAKRQGFYGSAVVRFSRAAKSGDADAQNRLGNIYYLGLGVPRDVGRATALYEKAAFNGNSAAQINMGLMHANGLGVSLDLERAYGWFRLAKRSGNERAQIYVDYMAERYSMAPNMTKDIENRFQTLSDFKQQKSAHVVQR